MDAATQRKLYLTVKTPGRDLAVKIDAHRVRQVLINFLGNAVKFTNEGGVTLTATFEEETADVGCLTFSVADTGIGISETDKPRVFGMFEQASGLRGTRVANAGTGLGLALCQRLASVMGGKIGLRSELGKGSVFHADVAACRLSSPDGGRTVGPSGGGDVGLVRRCEG